VAEQVPHGHAVAPRRHELRDVRPKWCIQIQPAVIAEEQDCVGGKQLGDRSDAMQVLGCQRDIRAELREPGGEGPDDVIVYDDRRIEPWDRQLPQFAIKQPLETT
jgi:hypothetical protein